MADEDLDYTQMLSALQGLLGQTVFVTVELQYDRYVRPLATLVGILASGRTDDLSRRAGAKLGYPPGDMVAVAVGEGSWFVIRRDDFKRGRREQGWLTYETRRAQTHIAAWDAVMGS